jgi:hypothetical protein
MKSNLCLHAGASSVERAQLATIRTPERTSTWVPIPHDRLLNGITDNLEQDGLTITGQAHGLTRDGARYFGLLEVAYGPAADDFGMVIGIRNSHDKSFPAGLVVGASVFVCDNLSFSGEIKLARKHTVFINRDLPQLIRRALGQLETQRDKQERRFAGYKETELTHGQAHDLIVRAVDALILPVTRLPDVLKEWREPRHEEFRTGGKTAWRLFNAFSECLKGNLDYLPKRTQALHGLMDIACKIDGAPVSATMSA